MKIRPMPRSRTSSSRMRSTCELHRDVERRCRLVGDQQFGPGDQHHGDHDALAHAAGDLVRIEVADALGIADLHRLQHFQRPLARLAPRRRRSCVRSASTICRPMRHHRVERKFRVLQDHGDALAAHRSRICALGELKRSMPSKRSRFAATSRCGGVRPHDGAAGHATCRSRIRRRCRASRGRA